MKHLLFCIFFIYLINSIAYACDGDCIKCHPKLLKNGKLDNNHKILKSCMKCHVVNSQDLKKMGSVCGEDCWQCHDVSKVTAIPNRAHKSLNKCIACHKKLDKQMHYNPLENSSKDDFGLYNIVK